MTPKVYLNEYALAAGPQRPSPRAFSSPPALPIRTFQERELLDCHSNSKHHVPELLVDDIPGGAASFNPDLTRPAMPAELVAT